MVFEVKSLNEYKKILNGTKFVVTNLGASWCGPCRRFSPTFEKLNQETLGVVFVHVDVDEQKEIAKLEGSRSVPHFVLYKGGRRVASFTGARESELKRAMREHFV